jgi:peroxiredoxin
MSEQKRISVGDRIPDDAYFGVLNEGDVEPKKLTAKELFSGKKVVLFGIPGTLKRKTMKCHKYSNNYCYYNDGIRSCY